MIRSKRSPRSIDVESLAKKHNVDATVHLTMPIHVIPRDSLPKCTNCSRNNEDNQLQLNLSPSIGLIDDSFVFIRRYDNTSVQIDYNRNQMAKECFYRGAQSALDLCEENLVSAL